VKFLIVDTYYPRFLAALYAENPGLSAKCYDEQKADIMRQAFGTADFYSANLHGLGHEAEDVIANADLLQHAWAKENGVLSDSRGSVWSTLRKAVPFLRSFTGDDGRLRILAEQIRRSKADVLYFQDLSLCPPSFLKDMRRHARLIVGQIACPLPPQENLYAYDVILTSLPNYVEMFRRMGIAAELLRIGFDPRVLGMLGTQSRQYDCTFVGGFSPYHNTVLPIFEEAARRVKIDFFGYGADTLAPGSSILQTHHGEVWGLAMYQVLLKSKMTINRHIVISENYANNMRLYEATGCGALLITDSKSNLNDLFDVGKEVLTYTNAEDLCEIILHYTSHEQDRATIAKAGQARTLREHTYLRRMEQLLEITEAYIAKA
jgi:spore maturation protein CgeB